MNLVFENSKGEERIIAHPNSLEGASNAIAGFLAAHKFKSYYTSMQLIKETPYKKFDFPRLQYDVGSHSEFFYLDELSDDAIRELKSKNLVSEKSEQELRSWRIK